MEHMWNKMKIRMQKSTFQFKNKEELWDKMQDIWNNIDVDTCIKLIETMPVRIKDTIKAKGGYIDW
jgi:hypothetical protein